MAETATTTPPGWGERQREIERLDCEIVGAMPADLDGALCRLGGAWYYPPKFADDIILHADGIVSMFRVSGGKVGYAARYVETERMVANREKARMRFGYYRNRFTDDEDVRHLSASAANTTAWAHGGRLLALKEDGLPYEIDPLTLKTLSRLDWGGALESITFTAHPMTDGRTGELIAFGYQARGNYTPDVMLWTFAPEGSLKHKIHIDMPWLDMVHDMAITENHILLPLGGYIASEEQARTQGGPMWQWDPQAPARIGILRRDGDGSDLRWFTGLKSCQLHTFNAWEEGSRIMLDAPFYDGNPFPFLRSADGSPWSPAYGKAHLRRLHFDLASVENTWREERLFAETVGDLGDVDPRFIGYRHRYCFGGIEAPLPSGATRGPRRSIGWVMPDAWARYDVEARTMSLLRMGDDYAMGECRFVPKAPDAREGEGWLVGVATNMAAGRGELIVADAEHLEDGPLARALLPFPAAPQVHGCWVPAGALALPDLG